MDAHEYARLASLIGAERSAVGTALARFRTHHIGSDWRGPSRHRAEAAHDAVIEVCQRSLSALDDAEHEARRLWRAALTDTHFLGM